MQSLLIRFKARSSCFPQQNSALMEMKQNTQTGCGEAVQMDGMTGRCGKAVGRGPSSSSYLRRYLLDAGLVFNPSLRVVEGRLGLGVSACR